MTLSRSQQTEVALRNYQQFTFHISKVIQGGFFVLAVPFLLDLVDSESGDLPLEERDHLLKVGRTGRVADVVHAAQEVVEELWKHIVNYL